MAYPILIRALAVLAISTVSGVIAGSEVWEGSYRLQAPQPVERLTIDTAGYAIQSAAPDNALSKRWAAMTPLDAPGASKLWPDKTISYCFATQQAEDELGEIFHEATRKWQRAGLHPNVYRYKRIANSGSSCVNYRQRDRILVITYNDQGRFKTSLGMASLKESEPDYVGPIMILSTRDDVGMLDSTANVAHEIGHAWGLVHEHQNKHYWTPIIGAGPMVGSPFEEEGFNCKALKDYEDVVSRMPGNDDTFICHNRAAAAVKGFTAMDWLPILEDMIYEFGSKNADYDGYNSVDWNSIMIYPSGAGGKGNAGPPGPGQDLGANDHRQDVLIRRDGKRMHANFDPTDRDVAGIKRLYEDPSFPQGLPVLINDDKHKHWSKFTKIFKKDKC